MSPGGKISRFDLRQATIVLDIGIGCKGVHESLDHIDGIAFLVETNRWIDKQKEEDTKEVFPIWRLMFTIGEHDGHESSTFHDLGQRVPHETQELGKYNF